MSAEKSPQWLIDALYQEHDEQPDNPASRDANAPLESEHSELVASYEAMLVELRQGLVMHTPRHEVSDSIRAAARKQAEVFAAERDESGTTPGRRAPSGASASSQSFWSRAKRQGALQIVAVLAVCLGAGLLVRMMAFAPADEARFEAAGAAPESEVAFLEEAEPESSINGAPADEAPAQLANNNDFDAYDYDRRADATKTADGKKDVALVLREQNREAQNEIDQLLKGRGSVEKKRASRKSAPPSTRSKASKDSKSSLDDELWGVAKPRSTSEASAVDTARKESGFEQEQLSIFGGTEDVAQEQKMADAPITSGKADSVGNSMGSLPSSAAPRDAPAKRDPGMAPAAEAVDEESERQNLELSEARPSPVTTSSADIPQEPSSTTLADAERAYKKNDYEQTLSDADAYLGRGIGSNNERARAMELKAQALSKLGRSGESQQVYESLREQYPDYYRKENIHTKKKQRKAAPKRKTEVDFSAEDLMQSY